MCYFEIILSYSELWFFNFNALSVTSFEDELALVWFPTDISLIKNEPSFYSTIYFGSSNYYPNKGESWFYDVIGTLEYPGEEQETEISLILKGLRIF